GHREAAVLAVEAGGLLPARRRHANAFAEEGYEDLCLLVAEPGEGLEVGEELRSRRRPGPYLFRTTPVALDERPAEVARAVGHRPWEPVQGRTLCEQRSQVLGFHGPDLRRVQAPTETLLEL